MAVREQAERMAGETDLLGGVTVLDKHQAVSHV